MALGGAYPRDFIDNVRNASDIVRLVSDYVPLKQAGQRLKGLCPFHQEKTPSFSVDPSRQLFYCFGCQTGGDIFKFVQLYEKLDFREAAEFLAKRFGVPLPQAGHKGPDQRGRVIDINRAAEAFFRACLAEPIGAGCRRYLEQRGLGAATVERLGLGFAPDTWEALRGHLLSKRFNPGELVKAGLTLPRKSGQGEYDRFRGRLIFPIHDVGGRTIAFGGRALGDAEPKYLNSPETPAYVKGEHLYGLDLARDAIRREGFVVVVEGYMDLGALLQAGIENVVASLGTAFTPNQARLLARFTDRVVFSYDGDAAGAAATTRSLDALLERGFNVRVVELPGGQDPDDTIKREGAEAYVKLVRNAPEYLQFLINREARQRDLGRPDEQVAAINAVLPHIGRLRSPIERATWSGRIADTLGIDDDLVLQELRAVARRPGATVRHRPRPKAPRQAEARLVSLLLASDQARREMQGALEETDLGQTPVAPLVETILRLERNHERVDYPTVLNALEDEEDRDLLTRLAFQDEPDGGPGVAECLETLRRDRLLRLGRQETRRIVELQREEADSSEVDEHLLRVQELARRRDALT
jgi:DNA primase